VPSSVMLLELIPRPAVTLPVFETCAHATGLVPIVAVFATLAEFAVFAELAKLAVFAALAVFAEFTVLTVFAEFAVLAVLAEFAVFADFTESPGARLVTTAFAIFLSVFVSDAAKANAPPRLSTIAGFERPRECGWIRRDQDGLGSRFGVLPDDPHGRGVVCRDEPRFGRRLARFAPRDAAPPGLDRAAGRYHTGWCA
jgi:hypothetical protein